VQALVADSAAPFARLSEVAEPVVRSDQALVAVHAVSLNRGELRRLEGLAPGTVTGWDLAGVVQAAAADGSGPPAGARVVGLVDPNEVGAGTGAWAQRAAVPAENLAVLPDAVSFEAAAALPVAALTALRALHVGGFVLGCRVLVTGASGGVGRFAIQLARLGGAHVTAIARRTEGLAQLGAEVVADELAADGPEFDVVLDALGGAVLGVALQRVAPRGTVVSFASTIPDPVSYPARSLFARASGARLYGLYLFDELAHTRTTADDLARLAQLLADGRLDPQIDLVAPWTEATHAITALLERRVAGKAVLTLT
jgi:NADPH:quinone reductase-like Zn-dependent oxidoreductase